MEHGLKDGKTYFGELFKEKRISSAEVLLQLVWEERDASVLEVGVVRDEQNRNSKCTQNTCFVLFF